ncbi:MAG: DUF4382 domain-containing protein [Dehalococcoidales bacterium]|nr:MAG: DUF4382 domain-containing protein [Dehalococcoidales bacterium]
MRRHLAILVALILVPLLTGGCEDLTTLFDAYNSQNSENVNFRLLISDEVNAIGDFENLYVTITKIGVHKSGDPGSWLEFELEPAEIVDLTDLPGSNATEIWTGQLDEGTYTKIFIYVSEIEGIPNEDGDTIKLPSGKLHLSYPFEITEGELTEFVYDVTVVEAGESGQYVIQPQIAESGPNQEYEEVN